MARRRRRRCSIGVGIDLDDLLGRDEVAYLLPEEREAVLNTAPHGLFCGAASRGFNHQESRAVDEMPLSLRLGGVLMSRAAEE